MPQDRAILEGEWLKEDWTLFRLSEANKDNLLEKSIQLLEEQRSEAIRIIENLERYNAAVAKNFTFKKLAFAEAPFRLLFRHDASIVNNHSHSVSSYIIISYCWHNNEEWSYSGLSEMCEPWPIQNAFVEDIVQLRESADEGIWIDQLSIDQDNEEEKSAVVGAMDIIYSSARQLIIVLEDIVISHEQEEIINRYFEVSKTGTPWEEWDIPGSDLQIVRELFRNILSCRWFTRAWCSHEFRIFISTRTFRALNSNGKVVCISSLLLVDFFYHSYHEQAIDEYFHRFQRYIYPSRIQHMHCTDIGISFAKKPFVQEFHDTAALGCSEENDKLQISINLAGLPMYWKGKTKGRDEAYWNSILLALATGDASVLGFCGPSLLLSEKGKSFYSWARRAFNPLAETRPLMNWTDMRIVSATREILELDLIFFEKPATPPSTGMLGLASKILQDTGLGRISEVLIGCYYPDDLLSGKRKIWADGIAQLLACALECGLEWMSCIGQGIFMQEPFKPSEISKLPRVPNDFEQDAFNKTLSTAAETIIASLKETGASALGQEVLDSIVNFLATITHPRFYISNLLQRTQISLKGDQALVTLIESRQRLAIPAALTTQNCTSISRVWVLEEVKIGDGLSAWRLVDKSFALMCTDFTADGFCVVERKRQRVVGAACPDHN